nr:exocyst complex component EXO70A1-like [Ipomoea batatas]
MDRTATGVRPPLFPTSNAATMVKLFLSSTATGVQWWPPSTAKQQRLLPSLTTTPISLLVQAITPSTLLGISSNTSQLKMGCFMYAFGSSNAAALIALPSLISPSDAFMSRRSETTLVLVSTAGILSRLAEAARGILSESENVVLREPSKIPVPRGTIHPLTRYAMNYASLISDYKQTLVELIVSKHARYGFHRAGRADSIGPPFDLDHCDFAVQFRRQV